MFVNILPINRLSNFREHHICLFLKNHEISIENANSQLSLVILINSSSTSILTRFIPLQTHSWALKHETMHTIYYLQVYDDKLLVMTSLIFVIQHST